ncbi:MAG: hypothetical protein A2Y74_01435 [Actinobacteria bacterium RBG_13_63_9]|nr:MAG: hypothetical protein A2Y74_01435 [Actinobacteria bacterium RBG_13_63_9]
MEERDRFQIAAYGHVRNGFREDWEPTDDRPLLIYPVPFWRDRMEQATYEAAVAGNPIKPGKGPFSYIRRISEIVTQEREPGLKPMPHVRQSRHERDVVLARLRGQATGKPPPEDDGGPI